jgi:hypothetical protein
LGIPSTVIRWATNIVPFSGAAIQREKVTSTFDMGTFCQVSCHLMIAIILQEFSSRLSFGQSLLQPHSQQEGQGSKKAINDYCSGSFTIFLFSFFSVKMCVET